MALPIVQVFTEQREHASATQPLSTEQAIITAEETLQDKTPVCDATDGDSNDSEDDKHTPKFQGIAS